MMTEAELTATLGNEDGILPLNWLGASVLCETILSP